MPPKCEQKKWQEDRTLYALSFTSPLCSRFCQKVLPFLTFGNMF